MPEAIAADRRPALGALLKYWRGARNMSQLALASEAEISPRHLCFVETGRAKPSREMVRILASVLDVPLRERNALLLAAGFAPEYRESSLDAPELGVVRAALQAMLLQQEPFPAVVMNRHWDLVQQNAAAERFFGFLLGGGGQGAPSGAAPEAPNVIRLMFHPQGLRPYVANWEAVAETLVLRVYREAVGGVADDQTHALLDEIFGYPGVPKRLRRPDLGRPQLPVVPVQFEKNGRRYEFFSAVTTLGTPQDVTVQEIRLESFFPASADTERYARELATTPT